MFNSVGKMTVACFSANENGRDALMSAWQERLLVAATSAHANDNRREMMVMVEALRRVSTAISCERCALRIADQCRGQFLGLVLGLTQIPGLCDNLVENIFAISIFLRDIGCRAEEDLVVVSRDFGGVVRDRELSH